MQQRPAIAVVAPNVLMGVGLKAILEKIIPMADVELFGDFETFAQATPERFFHFFVAAQLFVTHSSYFRPLRHKTILLCNGQPQPAYADDLKAIRETWTSLANERRALLKLLSRFALTSAQALRWFDPKERAKGTSAKVSGGRSRGSGA